MGTNSVIIATNAIILIQEFLEKLQNAGFLVSIATDNNELKTKIKLFYPRYVFLEHCFHGSGTDEFIYDIMRINRNIHIVMWASADKNPHSAARFILAEAENFFSLRYSTENMRIFYLLLKIL